MAQGQSRAELLERCKAAGLKATAWKKAEMLEALEGLEGAALTGVGDTLAEERVQELTSEPQEPRETRPRVSGWCLAHWPLWVVHHTQCRARPEFGSQLECACQCHSEGWVRPPVPAGAALSKFETERAPDGNDD